jgi:hypothetical protein
MSESAVQSPSTLSHAGRDRRGRFSKGNRGGPGNPFGRQVALLRAIALTCVGTQDIQEIMTAMVLLAKGGSITAARFVFTYTVGKPVSPTGPDSDASDAWDLTPQSEVPGDDRTPTCPELSVSMGPGSADPAERSAQPSTNGDSCEPAPAPTLAVPVTDRADPAERSAHPSTNGESREPASAPSPAGPVADGADSADRSAGPSTKGENGEPAPTASAANDQRVAGGAPGDSAAPSPVGRNGDPAPPPGGADGASDRQRTAANGAVSPASTPINRHPLRRVAGPPTPAIDRP